MHRRTLWRFRNSYFSASVVRSNEPLLELLPAPVVESLVELELLPATRNITIATTTTRPNTPQQIIFYLSLMSLLYMESKHFSKHVKSS